MPGLLDRVRRRELLALASARRADRDPSAQDLANRLAEKRLEEVATTEALRVVDESLVQYAQALTALTEARSKAAAILQQLAEAGAPDGAQDDEVLASLIAGLESQLENLEFRRRYRALLVTGRAPGSGRQGSGGRSKGGLDPATH